jgi:hypothetical protein
MGRAICLMSRETDDAVDLGTHGDMNLLDIFQSAGILGELEYGETIGHTLSIEQCRKAAEWIGKWIDDGMPKDRLTVHSTDWEEFKDEILRRDRWSCTLAEFKEFLEKCVGGAIILNESLWHCKWDYRLGTTVKTVPSTNTEGRLLVDDFLRHFTTFPVEEIKSLDFAFDKNQCLDIIANFFVGEERRRKFRLVEIE